MYLGECSTHCF